LPILHPPQILFSQKVFHKNTDIYGVERGSNSGDPISMNADGSRIAIADEKTKRGRVRVFDLVGAVWVLVGGSTTLVGEDQGDLFGWSFDLTASGSRLVVGAKHAKGQLKNRRRAGQTMIFDYNGDTDAWVLATTIDGLGGWDKSGYSVAISAEGHNVVIAAPYNDEDQRGGEEHVNKPEDAGYVRVFEGPSPHAGANGDPHFATWRGEHFEYHGKCDLELVSDPTFADGKGLVVNIRTEIVRTWSYIKNAVIRIDDDIIEVQGGSDKNRYWFNKVYQAELTTIGGFPVKYSEASSKQRLFKIELGVGEEIQIRTYKEFVRIDFKEPKKYLYGNTVGLLADFNSGKKFARDGFNVIEDYNKFGQEWQVLPEGPMLFHEVVAPQLPDQKCILPIELHAEEKQRRLGEATVTEIQAELACSKISPKERDACVFDVLATDDLDMAGSY
jgi:hypothetical protein